MPFVTILVLLVLAVMIAPAFGSSPLVECSMEKPSIAAVKTRIGTVPGALGETFTPFAEASQVYSHGPLARTGNVPVAPTVLHPLHPQKGAACLFTNLARGPELIE